MNAEQTLPLEEITKIITDSILADNILDKEKLPMKIKSLLKIWLKVRDIPKDWDNPNSRNTKTDLGKMKRSQNIKDVEAMYWREQLRIIIGEDNMKHHYKQIETIVSNL